MTTFTSSYTKLAKEMLEKLGQNFKDPVHSQNEEEGYFWKKNDGDKTEYAFEMSGSVLRFGPGVTKEVGHDILNFKAKNPVVITDKNVKNTTAFKQVEQSLKSLGISYEVFDKVKCEPAVENAIEAIEFCRAKNFDCFIAVGGGSTIDTTKTAALYTSNPEADVYDFFIVPFGKGLLPQNKTLPIIAIPTTAGTGSECTAAAVFDMPEKKCKCGIRVRAIKPHLSLVDPLNVVSMPRNVAIYSGFDVLSHALESFTNKPYYERLPRPEKPEFRPLYQGANPISDVWARETLRIVHKYFRRAVSNPDDIEARSQMQLAACYAGMGIGNAGVHFCHGLSYPISSQGKFCSKPYVDSEYDGHSLIPHGLSVIVTAPAVFQFTVWANPKRHLEAARILGADLPV
uniref:hydroxyacid-oxoacid transhydrogenase n=1 Tax=Acrobeloides nanus TaxID=290746 RepID=A0A914E0R9_9BILA